MINLCGVDELEKPMDQRCAVLLTTIGDALYAVGGKWTLRVIIAVAHGNKRFNELQRAVTGISARVLSNELRELELNGFVKRTVHADLTPVLVEYVLTDYSNTLEGVVQSLSEWGAMHRNKVRQPVT